MTDRTTIARALARTGVTEPVWHDDVAFLRSVGEIIEPADRRMRRQGFDVYCRVTQQALSFTDLAVYAANMRALLGNVDVPKAAA